MKWKMRKVVLRMNEKEVTKSKQKKHVPSMQHP